MVYRIYVEKKQALANESKALLGDAKGLLGIDTLENVRIINRYDVENLPRDMFEYAVRTVFSEPQLDNTAETLKELCGVTEEEVCSVQNGANGCDNQNGANGCSAQNSAEISSGKAIGTPGAAADNCTIFAVEYLPGQFDQRADSAAQCIQILSQGERPLVASAKVYILEGRLSEQQLSEFKKYVINPVEAREASLVKPETLKVQYDIPTTVATLDGFTDLDEAGLLSFIKDYGLAMDLGDITFCRQYFKDEGRNPTITEIRMIDTYWSDHCRHTTFSTIIDKVDFEDPLLQKTYEEYIGLRKSLGRTKPICLMDLATIAVKHLRKEGLLDKLDESEEINACTVKIQVEIDGKSEPWLLLFKNETHNHPTEIEPFGGAATCVGGAIRDPLSGRAYVYGAMRVTGAADPLKPVSETLTGKLPQRKIVTTAAAGYSSYGNQIGLATGIVDELYHPGYAAKRMEIGAVIAAAPAANVRRETPAPGDVVILLGGSTGRDGIGGATGSSKAHDSHSVETCGAEVQKGNAPEERKLQRLFRNGDACRMIKRCNDFGAGGVSVAIGELADGLKIDLNAVPKKYEGLDGTELAISESQERMAVVVEKGDADKFLKLAASENLQACPVAVVTESPRLVMNWNGNKIVDISREFLNSNGAEKHISISAAKPEEYEKKLCGGFAENYKALASDLNTCSRRGLSERFDSTIGAGTVLMPFGGKRQRTPIQAMVHKIPVEKGATDDCSLMTWGYNPFISEKSPYHGAYLAVVESVCKLIATGAAFSDVYLSFQEYFEQLRKDGKRWGKPLSALLGAFRAQMELGIGAIGGKDSMSGSFENLDVPPTLVSFAVTTDKVQHIVSPEFKNAGNSVFIVTPEKGADGLPTAEALKEAFTVVERILRNGGAVACYTPGLGGVAEAVMKMTMGNGFGFEFDDGMELSELFGYSYGSFILELAGAGAMEAASIGVIGNSPVSFRNLGEVIQAEELRYKGEAVLMDTLCALYEDKLESVFSCNIGNGGTAAKSGSAGAGRGSGGAAAGSGSAAVADFATAGLPGSAGAGASTCSVSGASSSGSVAGAASGTVSAASASGLAAVADFAAAGLPGSAGAGTSTCSASGASSSGSGAGAASGTVSAASASGSGAASGAAALSCATAGPGVRTAVARPKVLIPAFPGTNCEYDSARAVREAGADAEIMVIRNLTAPAIQRSAADFAAALKTAQMVFIPGGFSGGDEPDGSGKFITAFFRNAAVKAAVTDLLDNRAGLICGICNGFQALIKLGLVPYGKIIDTDENCPTLTYNIIGRHQSKIVRTKIVSNMSPWLKLTKVGNIYNVPISHGEGRFLASSELVNELAAKGQIATQYVDLEGNATMDVQFNPNGSLCAIEGITSPDGRVFGKMGHSERVGSGLYKNVPGNYDIQMFKAAVAYFKSV